MWLPPLRLASHPPRRVPPFLVPKPRLGNTLAGEAPASRDGRLPEAGASGADAFPSRGLGTRKKLSNLQHFRTPSSLWRAAAGFCF